MNPSDQSLFAERRKRFLKNMEPGSVAIFPTSTEVRRSNDTEYEFRPDTDFYYLTGFPEPDAVAIFTKEHGPANYTLFVRPRDPKKETWSGRRAGPAGARKTFGADAAFPTDDLERKLPEMVANAKNLYFFGGRYSYWDQKITQMMETLRGRQRRKEYPPRAVLDPTGALHSMRLIKTSKEIKLIREAVEISSEAHREVMAFASPGIFEYEMQAVIEYVFRKHGAKPGYGTIVGAGDNATILHYVSNTSKTSKTDLVLVDAGAEPPSLFTGDITRTFPTSGKFSKPQQTLYEIVLDAQEKAIATVKKGNTLDDDVHKTAVLALTEGLISEGILKGNAKELIETEAYKKFYPHRTSHWLGMDVHDAGDYYIGKKERPLEPGMVITVEPGIYIPKKTRDVPKKFLGLGIRIEDDILVTTKGHDILSKNAPKKIRDIETEMKRKSIFS